MTFSQIPDTWRRWRLWNKAWLWIPGLLFVVLLVHGGLIGLTDDEAYYWVLAQRPAFGYAYHPPAVAWWIAVSQAILSPLFGKHHEIIVRFPSVLTAAVFLAMALRWMERVGVEAAQLWRAAMLLLSVAGLFAVSWMMVPDVPMFLGWTASLILTWDICFAKKLHERVYVALGLALALTVLSKFSGVLAGLSSLAALVMYAPRSRLRRGILALLAGGLLAAAPILIWNMQHEWVAIFYQFKGRHSGGAVSWLRYARFWGVEFLIAGPVLLAFLGVFLRKAYQGERIFRFLSLWLLPGAIVFLTQPLFSDFKPHWALIVWWPLALGMAIAWARDPSKMSRRAWIQIGYGWALGFLILLSCHVPIGGMVLNAFSAHGAVDPRLDVSNDLYGWRELRGFLLEKGGSEALKRPVVGSRYQTASQAAFAIGQGGLGILLPRGIGDRDEWPEISVSESVGPKWPRLTQPVFFVADNRYSAGPQFPGARCEVFGAIEKVRLRYPAKQIKVWACEP